MSYKKQRQIVYESAVDFKIAKLQLSGFQNQ